MKVTLADIAEKTGVTVSTVQRALNGGGGVSGEKRAFIQKTAEEMGYRRNLFASSLRRGYLRIAIVFPDWSPHNRFFSHYLWAGVQRYLDDANAPFVEKIPLSYMLSPEDQTVLLQELLDGKHGHIDGVLTRGSNAQEVIGQYREFEARGIPVVLAGTDSKPRHRLCCVCSYEEMAGSTAADLLISFGALETKTKVIVCGNFFGLNQFNNSQGFERRIWEGCHRPDVLKVPSDLDLDVSRGRLREMLDNNPEIGAIYACSTRSTLAACQAVTEAGKQGQVRIIGSDLFEESVQMLRDGVISAIIHNRPVTIAQKAMQTLVSFLLNEAERPPSTILIDSAIVMRGNLDFYLRDIPALQKYADPEKLAAYDAASAPGAGFR